MTQELVNRVKNALDKPTSSLHKLNELKSLVKELCNYFLNDRCSSCIQEAITLLHNWCRNNNVEIGSGEHYSKAIKGEYQLKNINLFVQVYKSDNEERQAELDFCLEENKNSKLFANVIEITDRLTFGEMFALSKEYQNDINVFANSDIFFDETILGSRWLQPGDCWALSRWDVNDGGMCVLFDRKDSQDVWVFNGEVKQLGYSEFPFGKAGCDNRIAHELKQAGYNVKNPSKTVHALHLHKSNIRTYNPKDSVPEPYHFIHPHF